MTNAENKTARSLEIVTWTDMSAYTVFNSNGRRVKRLITQKEAGIARAALGDEHLEDSFCYIIV